MEEPENLLYCPALCRYFLSLLLLIMNRTTSSSPSASSLYSVEHNKVPAASVWLPCGSSGLCALHKYVFVSMVVLYGLPHQCMDYCFLFFWDLGQSGGPPPGLAPPTLLLTCRSSLPVHLSVLLPFSSVTGRSFSCHCSFPLSALLYPALRFTPPVFSLPPLSSSSPGLLSNLSTT